MLVDLVYTKSTVYNPKLDIERIGAKTMRVAVVDRERCRPDKCDQPCIRFCPMGKEQAEHFQVGNSARIAIAMFLRPLPKEVQPFPVEIKRLGMHRARNIAIAMLAALA